MRIALVSSEYPPFRGGGIGTYSDTLSRALARCGHQVHVVTNAWPGDLVLEPCENLTIHRLPVMTPDYRPATSGAVGCSPRIGLDWSIALLWSTAAAGQLEQLHAIHPFDVVEFPECFGEAYVSILRAKAGSSLCGLPMTVTLHSPISEIARHNAFVKRDPWLLRLQQMEENSIARADGVSSPSRALLALVKDRIGVVTLEDKPTAVIPNPLDPWWWQETPAEDAPARPYVLYVGRLEPRKGVPLLVDATVALLEQGHDFDVRLIGRDCDAGVVAGPMSSHLTSRIPERWRRHFFFEPARAREQLPASYANALACVFPSPWDNFPYTCAEAMACGAAVVVTSTTGLAEMLGDDAGIVVPPSDKVALATAMARLADSAEERRRLGQVARRRIATLCAPQEVAAARLSHYEEVIAHVRRRQRRPRRDKEVGLATRSIAVLLRSAGRTDGAAVTRQALEKAARQAGCDVRLETLPEEATRDMEEAWLANVHAERPRYLLTLEAGDWVGTDYLVRTLDQFERSERVGWATTWSEAQDGPYCGWDFTLPLDLTDYRPVPFAVIRRAAFDEVGGWNLQLPVGWRQWDLWLSLAQRGWQGVIIPIWAARHGRSSALDLGAPTHRKAYELLLEAIVERHRALFEQHGPELWLAHRLGHARPRTSATGLSPGGDRSDALLVDLLGELETADVTAPPGHVGRCHFFANYPRGELMLLAHPPARIAYGLVIPPRSALELSLAMHPAVYDQAGGAVRFIVRIDGNTLLDEVVDAKRRSDQRGWKDVRLPLTPSGGKQVTLELITHAEPEDEPWHCTAGWGVARIVRSPDRAPVLDGQFHADWQAPL